MTSKLENVEHDASAPEGIEQKILNDDRRRSVDLLRGSVELEPRDLDGGNAVGRATDGGSSS